MSRTGTVGLASMLSLYCLVDLAMSETLGCGPVPTVARGCLGVSGGAIWRASTGTWAWVAIAARTGPLAITLPNSTARCVSAWKS